MGGPFYWLAAMTTSHPIPIIVPQNFSAQFVISLWFGSIPAAYSLRHHLEEERSVRCDQTGAYILAKRPDAFLD